MTDKALAAKEFAVPALAPLANNIVKYTCTEGLLVLLKEFSGMVVAEQIAKYIPFVGTAIAASLGFAITRQVGNYYLGDCHRLAESALLHQFKNLPPHPSAAPHMRTPAASSK